MSGAIKGAPGFVLPHTIARNGPRVTTMTCRCCGQPLQVRSSHTATARTATLKTIWVDETLLACCNLAYDVASQLQAHDVTVAHLVYVVAREREYQNTLATFAIDPGLIATFAHDAIHRLPQSSHLRPQTSADLKTLLDRARSNAVNRRSETVTLTDCLHALFYTCDDLSCGTLVAQWQRDARSRVIHHEHTQTQETLLRLPRSERLERTYYAHRDVAPPRRLQDNVAPMASQHTDYTVPARNSHTGRTINPERPTGATSTPASAANWKHTPEDIRHILQRQEQLLVKLCEQIIAREANTSSRAAPPKVSRRKPSSPPAPDPDNALAEGTSAVSAAQRQSPAPVPVQPKAPRVALRDRLRRGTWLLRHDAPKNQINEVTTPPFTTRQPMLALVPSPRRIPAPSSALEPDEEDLESIDDDTADEMSENGERIKRFYLTPDDEIARAPSIGPRTAARIVTHGIVRVGDLLAADPRKLATKIAARHITPERVGSWQDQARLVCTIPWLRSTHAQILVGTGFNTVRKIQSAEPIVLCAAVRIFATTRDGQRVLRAGPPPDDARVFRWVAHAQLAEIERAA
jgi:Domain of unknown function (DUF4332)